MKNQVVKQNAILSIDAETDGLWGKAFAIGAVAYDEQGNEITRFELRSLQEVKNEWVRENVLSTLDGMPTVHTYEELLGQFANFYNEVREEYETTVLWHMGHVVEAFLFRELVAHGLIGEWDAPYTPIEVADHLRAKGFNPDSVDSYAKQFNIELPNGSTHNPVYDCVVAYKVYKHIYN